MSFERIRGDTQLQEFTITNTVNKVKSPLDLDLAAKIEFAFLKSNVVIIKLCTKNSDPLTGICYVDFTENEVSVEGKYRYDIQITWVDGRKTTYEVSTFELTDDVNKT